MTTKTNKTEKAVKIDKTVNERMKNRDARIKDSKLSNLKVIMHKDDAEKVRAFAKKLYEARGLVYSA